MIEIGSYQTISQVSAHQNYWCHSFIIEAWQGVDEHVCSQVLLIATLFESHSQLPLIHIPLPHSMPKHKSRSQFSPAKFPGQLHSGVGRLSMILIIQVPPFLHSNKLQRSISQRSPWYCDVQLHLNNPASSLSEHVPPFFSFDP